MRLKKSLDRLQEAPKIWYELLTLELTAAGLTEMKRAPCVLIDNNMVVMCYVDDILIMISDQEKSIN